MKFRAWDDDNRHYEYFDFSDINKATEIMSSYGHYFFSSYFEEVPPELFTGLLDKNEKEFWSGDIRLYRGKLWVVINDGWRFRLERNLVEFGENDSVVVDEDVAYDSELYGNIRENPELIKHDN